MSPVNGAIDDEYPVVENLRDSLIIETVFVISAKPVHGGNDSNKSGGQSGGQEGIKCYSRA